MIHQNILRSFRSSLPRNTSSLSQFANFCIGLPRPNPKTLVIVKDLPVSLTNESFTQALQGVENIRRTEVEPGCAIHILDEVTAEIATNKIRSQLKLKAKIANTCLPSVVLHNIPNSITTETLSKAFQSYDPKAIRFSGRRNITVTVPDASSVQQVDQLVSELSLGETKLQRQFSKSPDGRYCVNICNLPPSVDLTTAVQTVSDAVCSKIPTAVLSANPGNSKVFVRLNQEKQYYLPDAKAKLEAALGKLKFASTKPLSAEVTQVKKPVLFLHGVAGIQEEKLRRLCMEENSAERVQMTWRTKDVTGDLAVAYFKSETEAFQAMKWIKSANIDSKKIKASFQHVAEPAVKVENFPSNLSKTKFFELFAAFKVSRVDVLPSNGSDPSSAMVVVSNPQEAQRMVTFINTKNPGRHEMVASVAPVEDWCFELTFPENEVPSIAEIQEALGKVSIPVKSISTDSNISAYVAFETYHQASKSQNGFLSGSVQLSDSNTSLPTAYHGGGVISSNVSIYPSYTIEVGGVSQDESAQYVVDLAKEHANVFKAGRSATVKFKKHENLVGGLRALRRVEMEGKKLKPIRNHPIEEEGSPDYDKVGAAEGFDREHYQLMLKDYLSAEPAIRYQMAKNYFERALWTAQGTKSIDLLLDPGASSSLKIETRDLLNERATLDSKIQDCEKQEVPIPLPLEQKFRGNTDRLFEIFIQREDMLKYSYDFDEIEVALGPANNTPGDLSAWNNSILDKDFIYRDFEDRFSSFQKFLDEKKQQKEDEEEESREEDFKITPDVDATASDKAVSEQTTEEDDDFFEGGVIEDGDMLTNGGETKKSQFSVDNLRDHDGHLWNAIIIHEDTTQSITPAGRVMSYRILMTIGNLKGVGGYGIGKGSTPQLALNSAFRAALNNLIYLDLYENTAFAHDLKGRENNCYVYIRATPKERTMVASNLARAIFNSMGITSCSCKIVGRRQPYAMIRAIFKALNNHKNLDEIAKERGMRYLTLKWMYDHGL